VLIDPEPLLPTSGYRVLCHDAMLIDRDAEGMWPMGTQLKLTITMLVVGLPRRVVVQRCRRVDVDLCCETTGGVADPRD
jgi:hypothetical protein